MIIQIVTLRYGLHSKEIKGNKFKKQAEKRKYEVQSIGHHRVEGVIKEFQLMAPFSLPAIGCANSNSKLTVV